MAFPDDSVDGCRHDRAPLKRMGKICHERTGKCVYVLLCTKCGFTVTTDQLRALRNHAKAADWGAPAWAPRVEYRPIG
jgi:hypothetical protein